MVRSRWIGKRAVERSTVLADGQQFDRDAARVAIVVVLHVLVHRHSLGRDRCIASLRHADEQSITATDVARRQIAEAFGLCHLLEPELREGAIVVDVLAQ